MNFSANGQYLMFGGYHTNVGASSPTRQSRSKIGLAGFDPGRQPVALDAIYGTGTTAANNAMRTVVSQDGNQYWFGMSGSAAEPRRRLPHLGGTARR